MYAIILEWPDSEMLTLSAPDPTDNTVIKWLGYDGSNLEWKHGNTGGVVINIPRVIPSKIPCQWAWVFKFDGLKNV